MTAGLQFALDTLSMAEAESLAIRLEACWDVLEVGTGLLLVEGLAALCGGSGSSSQVRPYWRIPRSWTAALFWPAQPVRPAPA